MSEAKRTVRVFRDNLANSLITQREVLSEKLRKKTAHEIGDKLDKDYDSNYHDVL